MISSKTEKCVELEVLKPVLRTTTILKSTAAGSAKVQLGRNTSHCVGAGVVRDLEPEPTPAEVDLESNNIDTYRNVSRLLSSRSLTPSASQTETEMSCNSNNDLPLNLCMKDGPQINTKKSQSQSQVPSFSSVSASEEPAPGGTTDGPYRAVLKTKRCLLISIAASDENGEAADLDLDLEEINKRLTIRTNSGTSTGAPAANAGSNSSSASTQKKEFLGGLIRTGDNNKVEINIHVTKPLCPDCNHYQNFSDGQDYYSQFTNQEDVDAELYFPNYEATNNDQVKNDAGVGEKVRRNSTDTREFSSSQSSQSQTQTDKSHNQEKPADQIHRRRQIGSKNSTVAETKTARQEDLDQNLIQNVGTKATSVTTAFKRYRSSSVPYVRSAGVALTGDASKAGVGLPVSKNKRTSVNNSDENIEEVDCDGSEDPDMHNQLPADQADLVATDKNHQAKRIKMSKTRVCAGRKNPEVRVSDCQIHPNFEQAKLLEAIKKRSQNQNHVEIPSYPSTSKEGSNNKASQFVCSPKHANVNEDQGEDKNDEMEEDFNDKDTSDSDSETFTPKPMPATREGPKGCKYLRNEEYLKIYRTTTNKKTKLFDYYCIKPNCTFSAKGSVTVFTKLRMHFKEHLQPHLFRCTLCGRAYRYTFSLRRHMRDIHSSKKEKTAQTSTAKKFKKN